MLWRVDPVEGNATLCPGYFETEEDAIIAENKMNESSQGKGSYALGDYKRIKLPYHIVKGFTVQEVNHMIYYRMQHGYKTSLVDGLIEED